MADVVLKNIKKVYPNIEPKKKKKGEPEKEKKNNLLVTEEGVLAVHDFNLEIKDNEFIVLVGPSGCGKSTTLRMIAGLEEISGGELYIDGKLMNDIPPKDRDIAMVFQNYALYPHMTVYENMAFGLKLRHVDPQEIDRKVKEAAEILDITQYLDRKPKALSGGQRQRVAIGRAIVRSPKVFLMDEPLSNLDAKLRIEMRTVIRDIQRQVGITTVYVTHDQEEALAISDRIAVINHGVIQQIGTPHHIYSRPANVFVATFIGHSNLFYATLSKKNGKTEIVFRDGCRLEMNNLIDDCKDGQEVIVGVRPEEFYVSDKGLSCKVENTTFLGRYSNYFLKFADGICVSDQPSLEFSQDLGHTQELYRMGDTLKLMPDAQKINVFTADMEHSLIKDVICYEEA